MGGTQIAHGQIGTLIYLARKPHEKTANCKISTQMTVTGNIYIMNWEDYRNEEKSEWR